MNDFIVVYSAEVMRRIKSRPFQIGLLFGIFGIMLMIKLPGWINSAASAPTHIAIVGPAAITERAKSLLAGDYKITGTSTDLSVPTAATFKTKGIAAVVSIRDAKGLRITVYAKDPSKNWALISRRLAPLNFALATNLPQTRVAALMNVPLNVIGVDSHFATASAADAAQGIAFILLFFLYILILVNSQLVMSAVAEEKTSRIAELLIASISPVPLLYGKIAAATTLAFLQLAIWVTVAFFLSTGGTQASGARGFDTSGLLNGGISATEIISFLILFLLGFVQLSMLFAGVASLVNRTEDLGSVSMPIVMPVVGAFILAITALQSPDLSWIVATSFVPILSPFVMFARIAVTDVPMWQLVLCFAINVVTLLVIAAIAGKLYRVGMLLYGRAPNLKQVWAVIRS